MTRYFRISLLMLMILGSQLMAQVAHAQCAMCRATVENSISDGGTSLAAGLNTGILYLGAFPYLLVALIAFLWYRNSKRYTEETRRKYRALTDQ